jgi:hypothetical protein
MHRPAAAPGSPHRIPESARRRGSGTPRGAALSPSHTGTSPGCCCRCPQRWLALVVAMHGRLLLRRWGGVGAGRRGRRGRAGRRLRRRARRRAAAAPRSAQQRSSSKARPQPDSLVADWSPASHITCTTTAATPATSRRHQSNFGKSEAISYVNLSKFRPGSQQQFSYSQTPRSRQDLRGVRGVCVRLPTSESGCGRPKPAPSP